MHMLACKTKHRVHISPAPPAVPRSPSPHPPACKPSATTNRKPRGLTKQTGNSTSTEFLIMRICFAAGDHQWKLLFLMESQEEYSRVDALLKQSAWPPSKPSGTMKHICLHLTHFILIFDIHFNKKLLALKLSEGVFHSRGTFKRNFVDSCSFFSFLIFKE